MTAIVRCVVLIDSLALSVACSAPDRPTAPSATQLEQPSPPSGVLPLTGPATTYLFSERLSYPVSHFTISSQYVLYDNGAFVLQYTSMGGEHVGTYRVANGVITFFFVGDGNRWATATGMLDNDVLTVRYNEIMEHSDFENAVYRRSE